MVTGSLSIDGKKNSFDYNGVWQSKETAVNGWKQEGGNWYYYKAGVKQTAWLNVSVTWYYLSSSGAMRTGWLNDRGSWYYLASSDAMRTGWLQQGSTWYYLFGSGVMAIGTQTIDGKVSFFDSSGAWLGYK